LKEAPSRPPRGEENKKASPPTPLQRARGVERKGKANQGFKRIWGASLEIVFRIII